jgi:hypothetical protein
VKAVEFRYSTTIAVMVEFLRIVDFAGLALDLLESNLKMFV